MKSARLYAATSINRIDNNGWLNRFRAHLFIFSIQALVAVSIISLILQPFFILK